MHLVGIFFLSVILISYGCLGYLCYTWGKNAAQSDVKALSARLDAHLTNHGKSTGVADGR